MAKNVYEDQIASWHPQQGNIWELTVPDLVDPGFGEGSTLVLALSSCALPSEQTEKLTVPYLNTEVYFAGKTTIGEFAAEFNDFADQDTLGKIIWWRKQVWDAERHRAGLAADYKKVGYLKLYSADLPSPTYTRVWRLLGLWPSSHDPGQAGMENTGQVKVSVTLIADKALPFSGFYSGA